MASDAEGNTVLLNANGVGTLRMSFGGRNFCFKHRAYDASQPDGELISTLGAILAAGVPPNACNLNGHVATHIAAACGHPEALSVLLESGAHPNIRPSIVWTFGGAVGVRDGNGNTPSTITATS